MLGSVETSETRVAASGVRIHMHPGATVVKINGAATTSVSALETTAQPLTPLNSLATGGQDYLVFTLTLPAAAPGNFGEVAGVLGCLGRYRKNRESRGLQIDPDIHLPGDATGRDRPVAMAAAARGLARALYRSVRVHAPRSVGVLCIAVALQLTLLGTALASFVFTPKTVKAGALATASLVKPTGLETANGGCAGGSGQTNVSVTWTASAEKPDANGNAMINGYKLWRSTSSKGVYSEVGSTGVATSFTDVNPSGAEAPQVFVGNGSATKTVHAVNTSTNAGTSITTGTIGSEPNSMAVTPEGTSVVLAEGASSQVQIVTVSTDTVAKTVAIPKVGVTVARPDAVAISPNGKTAYIVDGANDLVYPITIPSGARGTGIAVGAQGDPGAIVVTPNEEQVYVANYSAHNVSVITTSSKTVTATVPIGAGETGKPIALAVTPARPTSTSPIR